MKVTLINSRALPHTARGGGRGKAQCRRPAPRAPRASRSGACDGRDGHDTLTFEDVRGRAMVDHHVTLSLSTIGPYFKLSCCYDGGPCGDAQVVLGETEGVILAPIGILHVDSMRIYNSRLKKLKREGGEMTQLGMMGLGRVLAKAIAAYGFEQGCTKAEILAINDDDETHRKLVLYYKRLGFKPVREVTGGIADLPHMLVWGGVGTRMDADLQAFLELLKS